VSVTVSRPSIAAAAAAVVVDVALGRAAELGVAVSVAVVDESGVLKAFVRMDDAPIPSIQLAQDKAYTAAGFAMATDTWLERLDADRPFAIGGPAGVDRLIVFGGGHPLTVGDVVVGGLGVSGAHVTQDVDIAGAGLRAFERAREAATLDAVPGVAHAGA
jgi:uncharacterized protein GlcG (DUF336 family)